MSEGRKNILITGGAGYIGIHCIISLVKSGYKPIVADNLYNATTGMCSHFYQVFPSSCHLGGTYIFSTVYLLLIMPLATIHVLFVYFLLYIYH